MSILICIDYIFFKSCEDHQQIFISSNIFIVNIVFSFILNRYLTIIFVKLKMRRDRDDKSPYRGTAGMGARRGVQDSYEAIIRNLEQENTALVDEINILKTKAKKVAELEDKTEMILRHNTQLLNENERLAKLINQKKSQIEIWKNKYESAIANKSSATDFQVKRLMNEIEKAKQEGCEVQHVKNLQITQLKNQQHQEIQALKRANLSNAEKYELEIRKLKEYCDKKDYEVSDLKMKVARIQKETDFQISKLKQEKQRLRNDLSFEENQHRKQVESLKNKFDYNFHSEIENLKKQHLNQIETLDYENSKLKEVINSKNLELEQAMNKQSKMRNHYEDSIELLKKQNDELKEKIVENQHIADLELNNLRDKLQSIKQSELALLRDANNNQCDLLNREISKLKSFLDSRNEEIQIICKERNQMRQSFEGELMKAQAALEAQKNQNRDQALRHEDQLKVCDSDLKQKNEEMMAMESHLRSQIQTLKDEKEIIDANLNSVERELERERQESRENQKNLNREIQALKESVASMKDEQERFSKRSNSDTQDIKKTYDLKIRQLDSKIEGLEAENKQKDVLIDELRKNIELLEKQLATSEEKIQFLENTEKQLRFRAKQNFSKWDAKEKELNRLIKEQIEGMQKTKANEIDELKSIHDNKLRSLRHQISQLERVIDNKNRNLNELKSQYDQLVNKFEQVFRQEAARKNLDIKVPGWLPDTLATKSLFDVFLKNKVIEYCS